MTNQNPYQKAAKAYQSNKDANLSPLQIVVELYKGLIRFMREGKQAVARSDFQTMITMNQKCFDILEALQTNLDLEQGGEDAKFLNEFYTIVFNKLSRILAVENPVAEYDALLNYIQPVYERWYSFAYGKLPGSETAAPAEAEAQ